MASGTIAIVCFLDIGGESPSVRICTTYLLRSADLLAVFQHTLCAHRGTYYVPAPKYSCAVRHTALYCSDHAWREGASMIVYRELSSLEQDLGISVKTLYAVSNNLRRHYRKVQIPKKNGGYRNLSIPDEILKKIQRKIADKLLIHMPVSRYATAYHFGSNTLKNAEPHVGKAVVLKLDIFHFFDCIRYSDVKDSAFPPEVYSENIRILLAMLCYCKDFLPQGAPSSPAITNILMYRFDETVGQWCHERGIAYTRYCDDMTFSGRFDPKEIIRFVRGELRKMGFLLNEQKTRIQKSDRQQSVTGIVVNQKANIGASYRRKLRQEIYYCQKFGVSEHLERTAQEMTAEAYLRHLLGKVNYVLQVCPNNEEFIKAKCGLQAMMRREEEERTFPEF